MVLTRGKVRLVVMDKEWEQTSHGMATFVNKLPGILRGMLGPRAFLPRTILSDRGTGFYQSSHGTITH
eukprot:10350881-Karenia_brevis.AAC.1